MHGTSIVKKINALRHDAFIHRINMIVIVLLIVSVLAGALAKTQVVYAVTLDGVTVGVAQSKREANIAVAAAENDISKALGHEYSFGDSVKVSAIVSTAAAQTDDIGRALARSVPGISEAYILKVDGVSVGAASSAAELERILDGIKARHETENAEYVGFVQKVSVESGFASDSLTRDIDTIAHMLDPMNAASKVRLTVRCAGLMTVSESVPYLTEYVYDDDMYENDYRIVTEGAYGAREATYSYVSENGAVIDSVLVSEVVVAKPITAVVALGTKAGISTESYGSYLWPARGNVTSLFGYRTTTVGSSNHKGIDICGKLDQMIHAADGGVVIFAGWAEGYGNFVKIQHDNGDVTCYGHLNSISVEEGQRVARSQAIGLMGRTGTASAIHLHFEIRVDGTPVNPMNYLP